MTEDPREKKARKFLIKSVEELERMLSRRFYGTQAGVNPNQWERAFYQAILDIGGGIDEVTSENQFQMTEQAKGKLSKIDKQLHSSEKEVIVKVREYSPRKKFSVKDPISTNNPI